MIFCTAQAVPDGSERLTVVWKEAIVLDWYLNPGPTKHEAEVPVSGP